MGRLARERIDVLLVDRGLAPNRSKAQAWVLAGDVTLSREGDETIAECEVWLDRQDGVRNLAARAWVALPQDPA